MQSKLTCACGECELRGVLDIVDRDKAVHYLDECARWVYSRRVGRPTRRLVARRTTEACDALRERFKNYPND